MTYRLTGCDAAGQACRQWRGQADRAPPLPQPLPAPAAPHHVHGSNLKRGRLFALTETVGPPGADSEWGGMSVGRIQATARLHRPRHHSPRRAKALKAPGLTLPPSFCMAAGVWTMRRIASPWMISGDRPRNRLGGGGSGDGVSKTAGPVAGGAQSGADARARLSHPTPPRADVSSFPYRMTPRPATKRAAVVMPPT